MAMGIRRATPADAGLLSALADGEARRPFLDRARHAVMALREV